MPQYGVVPTKNFQHERSSIVQMRMRNELKARLIIILFHLSGAPP